MIALIRFHAGTLFLWLGMALLGPWLIAMKLGLISNQHAKEKLLSLFFKNMDESRFQKICRRFFESKYGTLLRPEAVERIQELRGAGYEIVIVTASAAEWVSLWAEKLDAVLIASSLQVVDGRLTGKLQGANCNFAEKVHRIQSRYALQSYTEIHAYGDSSGDKEMLAIATHPFFRKFR